MTTTRYPHNTHNKARKLDLRKPTAITIGLLATVGAVHTAKEVPSAVRSAANFVTAPFDRALGHEADRQTGFADFHTKEYLKNTTPEQRAADYEAEKVALTNALVASSTNEAEINATLEDLARIHPGSPDFVPPAER